ncbi:myxosortase-dependent metalloprotease, MXAN_2677/MXAN_2678 family [Myxococcus stipitatus]|uniref:myxosortase-dependent metalloprotease, MXAN_2677/MXAN_2678 family n=1 Tax=Myxococcus stipitatus TaxID=83455 RepID=UPI0030D46E9C
MRKPLLLGLVLLGAPAVAQNTLPFQRTLVTGRPLCLLWPVREYVYHLDPAGSARTPGNTEVAAIEAAFDSWRRVSESCSDYGFRRGSDWRGPIVVGYDEKNPRANYNIITFRETACDDVVPGDDACWADESCGNKHGCWEIGEGTLALTTSTYSVASGRVLDADIEMNASQPGGTPGHLFTTVDSPPCQGPQSPDCVAVDLQNTMTHEIGHVVGLDHVSNTASTMAPTAPQGETRKRVIDSGSIAGFCSIYPRWQPPNQCVQRLDTGIVLLADGRGTGCASAPGAALSGAAWAVIALLRARRRSGGR